MKPPSFLTRSIWQATSNRVRIRTSRSRLNKNWIVEIDQPLVWICQLSRSGGTMLLRLLDGHPQVHAVPKPFSVRASGAAWPMEGELSIKSLRRKLDMSAINGSGLVKRSSNIEQSTIPIYFDGKWYREICRSLSMNAKTSERNIGSRQSVSIVFTAFFNAWRNYQNLYGEKKYVVGHGILGPSSDLIEGFYNFRACYPDGYWIFMMRSPDDWLASMALLKNAPANYGDITTSIAHYSRTYRCVAKLIRERGFVPIIFDDFVMHANTSTALASFLGLTSSPALEVTSSNGIPVTQNSSHQASRLSKIDPTRTGRGAEFRELYAHRQGYSDCVDAYESCLKTLNEVGGCEWLLRSRAD
jgi:hypothetical protein